MIGFQKNEDNHLQNLCYVIILGFIFFYILNIGASLIIPFIIAVLFSFAIIALSNFFKKLYIPAFFSFILSVGTYIGIFWLFGKMIGTNIDEVTRLLPSYQTKITSLVVWGFQAFDLEAPQSINEVLWKLDFKTLFTTAASGVTTIFSSAGIILFYVMFILLEYRFFKNKLHLMIAGSERKTQVLEIIEKIKSDVKSYFVIKGIVSLITSTVSYLVMSAFGLDFAVFWAVLIFILNFIPSVGSIIAVSFPALLALVQFEGYYGFVIMTSILIGVQVLMGNIIEPKFMGNKLNLSPLVIIISLGFWGSIWGIVGMLLSVPLMVIINIILAKIPATRSIAILLSEKWELQVDGGEEIIKERRKLFQKIKEKIAKKKKK